MFEGEEVLLLRQCCEQEPVWFKAGAQIFTGEGIRYLGAFTIPAFSSNIILTLGTEVIDMLIAPYAAMVESLLHSHVWSWMVDSPDSLQGQQSSALP